MSNTVEGLVDLLNAIAERKQRGGRTDRSFLALGFDTRDRAGIAVRKPHPSDADRGSLRDARSDLITEYQPCA